MKLNTEDFLWQSYFGITKTEAQKPEKKGDALIKCIDRAFADLARTVKYKYSSTKTKNLLPEEESYNTFLKEKGDFKSDARGIIQNGIIEKIFNINSEKISEKEQQVLFNQYHREICEDLNKENAALKSNLTYGQAQKWLNMTLKYMALMGLWKEELDSVKNFLHIPLDSYILKAVFCRSKRENINEKYQKDENTKDLLIMDPCEQYLNCANSDGALSLKKWNDSFKGDYKKGTVTWSNLTEYDDYFKIQEEVLKCMPSKDLSLSPLEWENKVWLASSQDK